MHSLLLAEILLTWGHFQLTTASDSGGPVLANEISSISVMRDTPKAPYRELLQLAGMLHVPFLFSPSGCSRLRLS